MPKKTVPNPRRLLAEALLARIAAAIIVLDELAAVRRNQYFIADSAEPQAEIAQKATAAADEVDMILMEGAALPDMTDFPVGVPLPPKPQPKAEKAGDPEVVSKKLQLA